MFPYIHIFGFTATTYWLCSVIGAAAVVLFLVLRNKKRRAFPWQDLLFVSLYGVVGGIIGAKVLYILTFLPFFIVRFNDIEWSVDFIMQFLQGGGIFYGGFYGLLIGLHRYCRRYNFSLKKLFALVTPAFPLFHCFGRIGCFMSGCCYGIEVAPQWGIVYTEAISAPNGVSLLPVQLIEAGFNLLLFLALLVTERFLKHKELNLFIYMASYGVARFVLEFFRGDAIRGHWFGLSTSQWIALFTIIFVIIYVPYYLHKQKRLVNQTEQN